MTMGCFLTLLLAIAALPTVCSLEVRREVKTLNMEAQWIIQSGIENEVPFFDMGLDGEGQVVAVSDTGIALDNCYFRDVGSTPSEVRASYLCSRQVHCIFSKLMQSRYHAIFKENRFIGMESSAIHRLCQ